MPLLLFLSAFLTALTGAVTGVRPVDVQIARQADASVMRRVAAVAVPAIAGHRHLLGAFGTAKRAAMPGVAPAVVAPRLYLDRPRA